jgi:hypothetical protein
MNRVLWGYWSFVGMFGAATTGVRNIMRGRQALQLNTLPEMIGSGCYDRELAGNTVTKQGTLI